MNMVCCLVSRQPEASAALETVARACSPGVACYDAAVVFDVTGCSRTIGPPDVIGREVLHLATAHGLTAHVAVAPTMTVAWLLAQATPGPTVVAPGDEAAAVATLPLASLEALSGLHGDVPRAPHVRAPEVVSAERRQAYRATLAAFTRWGLHTVGEIAALERRDVHARLGAIGVRLHQAACGEDGLPFVPAAEATPFVERIALEWPVEGLEPLAFVLARLLDPLSKRLLAADRGAVAVRTRLQLVTREIYERVLNLPAPIGDARVLRTLVLLDVESAPPPAAIDVVEIHLGVSPRRIVQGSLLAASVPTPEDLATLTARLVALMGESRVGSPVVPDTHDPRPVAMAAFRIPARGTNRPALVPVPSGGRPRPALRRFRLPVVARVDVERGAPVRVMPAMRRLAGGRVVARAGPYRTSGGWWMFDRSWYRDEWDLQLTDGGVYRVARNRATDVWEIEGVLD